MNVVLIVSADDSTVITRGLLVAAGIGPQRITGIEDFFFGVKRISSSSVYIGNGVLASMTGA